MKTVVTQRSEDREKLMGSASNYWRLVRLEATGQRRVKEVATARAFFQDRFAAETISDTLIQRKLLQLLRTGSTDEQQQAELCLRCFISRQIEQACIQLASKFGERHGFKPNDLFPFVLDDDIRGEQRNGRVLTQYQSLASEILRTFDADRAGLSTWVTRQVRHHRELRGFLQEHGVYLATDWGILNDTSPELLQSVLTEFYNLAPAEVAPACRLLQAYHQVYRYDRLQQRQSGRLKGREACATPNSEQLMRMARCLQDQGPLPSPELILSQLQSIASQLRQYRLHRSGKTLTEPLDELRLRTLVAEPSVESAVDSKEENFLIIYRNQILTCLDRSLAQVTQDRVTYLQRKKTEAAQQFLSALKLFHCQGQPMSEIAPQVGLQAQFQVTRLLKLREFRANVRSRLLQLLFNSILDIAKSYADPLRLQTLNQQIETILEEHIDTLIRRAEAEAAVARQHPPTSLFARRLCHHLDQLLDRRRSTP